MHRVLGHVSLNTVRAALQKGVMDGVVLKVSDNREDAPADCASCAAGKMTRKAIARERVREPAAEYGTYTGEKFPSTSFYSFSRNFSRFCRILRNLCRFLSTSRNLQMCNPDSRNAKSEQLKKTQLQNVEHVKTQLQHIQCKLTQLKNMQFSKHAMFKYAT